MGKKNRNTATRPPDDREFEHVLYHALRQDGMLFPETEKDVQRVEDRLRRNPSALPQELDASAVGDFFSSTIGSESTGVQPTLPVDVGEVEESLARAAREGGKILPHIEERMRHDREAAETRDS